MDLDQLKAKYGSVLGLIKQQGVVLSHLHVQDGKLFNQVWDEIKRVDASFGDLTCDLSVDESLPQPAPPAKTYVVVAGDSLWKIAAKHLGDGALYPKIIEANPGKLKDEHTVIHPGDELLIPNL